MTLLRKLLFNGLWIVLVVFVAVKGYEFFSTVEPTQGVAPNTQQGQQVLHTVDGLAITDYVENLPPETAIVITVLFDVDCIYCTQEFTYLQGTYGDNSSVVLIGIDVFDDTHDEVREYNKQFPSVTMFVLDTIQPPDTTPQTQIFTPDGELMGEFVGWDVEYGPIQIAQIITGGL
jgi:hypothetical protein